MFFKKLFTKKSYPDCEAKGDLHFAAGRFADARIEFEESLEILGRTDESVVAEHVQRLKNKLLTTNNELARLNIQEARAALASGANEKAEEYLDLAAHFSQDQQINREIAELVNSCKSTDQPITQLKGAHGCTTCTPHSVQPAEITEQGLHSLSLAEQFELLVSPLPEDLPQRYRTLGEEFANAYIAAHHGEAEAAFTTYARLHESSPSDIYLYEMAVIKAHAGAIREAENLLQQALKVNNANPICCLSLVQLFSDLRRFGDARSLLDRMHAEGILGKQVLLLLGDNAQAVGAINEAEEFYRQALDEKTLSSTAAERLIPLLEQSGRIQERDFLAKKHCGKGCC